MLELRRPDAAHDFAGITTGQRIVVGRIVFAHLTQPLFLLPTSVPFSEYVGRKKSGEVNSQWSTRPATMIRKVALAHALKEAFPEQNAGMNVQEEIPEVSDMVLDTNAIVIPEEEVTEEPKEERPADVAASIFG